MAVAGADWEKRVADLWTELDRSHEDEFVGRREGRNGAMQPCTAAVFDLFGTLVPAVPDDQYRRNHATMARLPAIPEPTFRRCWRDLSAARARGVFPSTEATVAHVCHTLGVAVSAEQITLATQRKLAMTRRTLLPRADALATLAAVQRQGLPIGLISDCSPEVPRVWAETPFVSFIVAPVLSCQVGGKKPAHAIYAHCCELLHVRSIPGTAPGPSPASGRPVRSGPWR